MTQESPVKPQAKNFNKPGYIIFVAAGFFFLLIKDLSQAALFIALALAFDPFKTEVPFAKRPFYQRAWLYVHTAVSLGLFVLLLLKEM